MTEDRDSAKRTDYDIETSARIQKALLAGSYDDILPGVEIYAEAIPSSRVDGDFYDFISLSSDSLDFLVGDVMGKGIPAALTAAAAKTAVYRSLIERLTREGGLPRLERIISDVEEKISLALIEAEKFLTLYYCRIDLARRLFGYIDAGHTGFCQYDASSGKCWIVKGSNMPLGFVPEQTYREYLLPVGRGDILLFYSDGISEAENAEGELFGEERIRQVVNAHSNLAPEDLVKIVINLTFFFSSCGFHDDVTALALRVERQDLLSVSAFSSAIDRADLSIASALRERFVQDLESAFPSEAHEEFISLSLAFAEALSNIIAYTKGDATVEWRFCPNSLTVIFDFDAIEFEWFSFERPEIGEYAEHGFGSWIIVSEFDSYVLLRGKDTESRIVMVRDFTRKRGQDDEKTTSTDFRR